MTWTSGALLQPSGRFAVRGLKSAAMALVLGCLLSARAAVPASDMFKIDDTWGGTRVTMGAVSVGDLVYVGYYDGSRQLSVARLDTRRNSVRKQKLDSIFAGWDAHNYIAMAYDRSGFLHVAGNMHSSPLVYARMTRKDDIGSLVKFGTMVGKQENRVTYPRFFTFPDGDLGFTYRYGESGDGMEIINKFDGKRWSRHSDAPVFSAASARDKVNAYHSGYLLGPDGAFHTAWVWRSDRRVETNFNVNYARSVDLRTWMDSRGRKIKLPITPSNAAVLVDKVPPGSGLFNNVRVGFNRAGEPIVSYVKHDQNGFTQLYHGQPGESGWNIFKMTDFSHRWQFEGAGTLPEQISFSGVRFENGAVTETLSHWKAGKLLLGYDAQGIRVERTEKPPAGASRECIGRKPWRQVDLPITTTSANSFRGMVVWRTLPRNSDRPRTCASVGLPLDCDMTSKLLVVPGDSAGERSVPLVSCLK